MKHKCRGSFTVEGAWVFPIVLTVLMSLLVFAMMLYDQTVTMACLNRCLTRAAVAANLAMDWESGELDYEAQNEKSILYPLTGRKEIQSWLEEKIRSSIEDEFRFITQITAVQTEVSLTRIRVVLTPEISKGFLIKFLPDPAKWEKTVRILRPEELVRAFGEIENQEEVPKEEGISHLLEEVSAILFEAP